MVFTINPVVYGNNRRQWSRCVALHFVGGVAGGALMWGLASALLHVLPLSAYARVIASMTGILLGVLVDARVIRIWVPTTGRQVPSDLRYRASREWVALRYGFELGLGVFTRVTFALTYSVIVACGLLLNPGYGLLCGGAFGLAHSAVVLRGRSAQTREHLTKAAQGLWSHTTAVRRVVIVGSVLMLVCLGAAVLTYGAAAVLKGVAI